MTTEFDLDDKLSFPMELSHKFLDGYYIILAPSYPNWLILNEDEYFMFKLLQQGATIREALEKYYITYYQDEDKCLTIMTGLLEQINDVVFFAGAEIAMEDPIETIAKKVHIGTTNGCNMRCAHCYMASGQSPLKDVNYETVIRIVNGLKDKYGRLEVVVSGGEPLTYKRIFDLLEGIKDNYIILFTNGSLIDENNIDLISNCCNEVQISFEGISKDSYGIIRDGNKYEKVLGAIDLLKKHGIRLVLAVTVLPSTVYDIRDNLITFIKKLNYNNLEVRINDEVEMSGNALTMDFSFPRKDVINKTVINIVRELSEIGCAVQKKDKRNIRFTNCGIGTNVVIDYDGKIYPCHKHSKYAFPGSIDVKDIIDEFNRLNFETSIIFIERCQNCELRYICAGGCRIDNYNETGSMTSVICNEQFKNDQLRELINDYQKYRKKG